MPVTLLPTTSPSVGEPGITTINITGSNFLVGTIPAANVTVTLQPASGGGAVNTTASAVTTIVGSTRRITFTIPASISIAATTAYNVSISGTTSTGTAFASSNTAALMINPTAGLSSVSPSSGQQGQTLSVTITGQFTNFVQGATQANFGAGISVGAAAAGVVGPVAVVNATTATANLTIARDATIGPRAVTVQTGAQQSTLATAFNVTPGTPTIIQLNPASGQPGQTLIGVVITGQFTRFTPTSVVSFSNAGVTASNVQATDSTHLTVTLTIASNAAPGISNVTVVTGTETATGMGLFTVVPPGGLTITDFNPKSAPVGTLVTITGTNLQPNAGTAAKVTLPKQGGGIIAGDVSTTTPTSLVFVIPAGAATGPLTIMVNSGSATTMTPLTVASSSSFSINAAPNFADLIRGQSTAYAINLTSNNGFNQLATLSVTGLPAGVTADFKPQQITGGQTSILTLTAPPGQPVGQASLTLRASATVEGIALSQTTPAQVNVVAPTTSFIGRTVVDDPLETSIASVTITMLGKDGNGATTGCSGTTVSDAAGNFALRNLPPSCIGRQLIGFDGTTATAPPGKYAGVNLVYTFVSGQVTASPVLVHLPRIDDKETFSVTQNAAVDQTYAFRSIPGLSVTVYKGTTFTLSNGSQPNPFPLVGVQVPVDRLPDAKPSVPTMLLVFIVAFQPANARASQPAAVYYPNTINTAPGANMALLTLDPTRGAMVPYGTGTVSADGTQVVPDPDPAFPGHRYGIVNFDWHGPMPAPPPSGSTNPSPNSGGIGGGLGGTCGGSSPPPCNSCPCIGQSPQASEPIDLASGLYVSSVTDIALTSGRGSVVIQRIYRTLSAADGPFGLGSRHIYDYLLDKGETAAAQAVNLIAPDNSRFLFSRQPNGSFINTTVGFLQGAVMRSLPNGQTLLRYKDGRTITFLPDGLLVSREISETDSNGNTITITRNLSNRQQITSITDPVGRELTFSYSGNHVSSITDPIGRTVLYTYNPSGTLATVTDAEGGMTRYNYDSLNRITSMIDARRATVFQNNYDFNGRVIQQTVADGGIYRFAYTLLNPTAETSPVLQTAVTDPRLNITTYRFNPQGDVEQVTDALGQAKVFVRQPGNGLLLSSLGNAQCPVCGPTGIGDLFFTYDANGNMLTRRDALGNTTTYTYDPVFNKVTSITDALGKVSLFNYDSRGNLRSRIDPNGKTIFFQYDAMGQLVQTTDPLNAATSFGYDAAGNLTSVKDGLDNITQFRYDGVGRLVETQDALMRKTSTAYDRLDRITSQTTAQNNVTRFSYDAGGNLLSLTDARNNATSFTYDSMNRLQARTVSLAKADTRQYDLNGNLVAFTDRRGMTSAFVYDAVNRLAGESYQDGSNVQRSYDSAGRLVNVNDSAGGVFQFSYDAAGRLLSSSAPQGTIQYTRDALGRVGSRQVAGQALLSYSYDAAGNLLSAAMPQTSVNFAYNARNQLSNISRLNGVSSTFIYDPVARLLTLTHAKGPSIIDTESYAYDMVGNRTTHSTSIGQSLTTQPTVSQYNAANQLVQFGPVLNAYDANGNLVQEGTAAAYTWDSRNRLKSIVTAAGQTTNFTYDFADNLIAQADSGTSLNLTKYFVLDDVTNVAYAAATDGTSYSVLSGPSIDSHLAIVQSNGQVQYGLPDAINSTMATVDQAGAIKSQFLYDSYGQTTTTGTYPFQFTGRVPISGSLYYYRARYYNAVTGRFISEDPIGVPEGSNRYPYASNDPTTFSDPLGLLAVSVGIGGTIGGSPFLFPGGPFVGGGTSVGYSNGNVFLQFQATLTAGPGVYAGVGPQLTYSSANVPAGINTQGSLYATSGFGPISGSWSPGSYTVGVGPSFGGVVSGGIATTTTIAVPLGSVLGPLWSALNPLSLITSLAHRIACP